jgi:hypothetical protein
MLDFILTHFVPLFNTGNFILTFDHKSLPLVLDYSPTTHKVVLWRVDDDELSRTLIYTGFPTAEQFSIVLDSITPQTSNYIS